MDIKVSTDHIYEAVFGALLAQRIASVVEAQTGAFKLPDAEAFRWCVKEAEALALRAVEAWLNETE